MYAFILHSTLSTTSSFSTRFRNVSTFTPKTINSPVQRLRFNSRPSQSPSGKRFSASLSAQPSPQQSSPYSSGTHNGPPKQETVLAISDNHAGWKNVLKGVRQLATPLWGGNRKLIAKLWTAATVFLAFATTAHAVLLSMTSRFFWNCLAAKDKSKFGQLLLMYVLAVALGPIAISLFTWVKERLALMWRRSLTNHLLSRYFADLNYYKLSLEGSSLAIDNPDQRISEDVKLFTSRAVRFMTIIGVAAFDLVIFSIILHKIYAPLLYALFVYALTGTVLIAAAGRNLLRLNRKQIEREANFRYGLVRARESTENIAFYRGEPAESAELTTRFTLAFRNAINLFGLQRNVGFLSTSFRFYAQVVPLIVIAPRYFAGAVQLGVMSQVYFSFNHVLSSVGLVVQEFQALSEFAAGIRRLQTLSDVLEGRVEGSTNPTIIESRILEDDRADQLLLRNLTVMTPSEPPQAVIDNLSLEVKSGERLLVIGQSGVGKSSLMRAVCGLWDSGKGVIERPSTENTIFLPQRVFLTLGTLRENVIYPSTRVDVTNEEVENALRQVNLGYLLESLGGLTAPGEMLSTRLSLGEQQRLAFARILISRPRLIVLDESTSALDNANERKMYSLISELGITCISVGNRPSLLEFHDQVLRLEGNGAWSLLSPQQVRDEEKGSLAV